MSIAPSRPVPSYPPPGGSSAPIEVSYDDFMAMPVTKGHVEVVDGVIYVMPGAAYTHQEVQGLIYFGVRQVTGLGFGAHGARRHNHS